MTTQLGVAADGRVLAYDASLYEFSLAGEAAAHADVQMMDNRGWVRWRAPELQTWFRRINPDDLLACQRRARAAAQAKMPQSRLVYQSSNEEVARVGADGTVTVCGAGAADVYVYRATPAGMSAGTKLVTIEVPKELQAPASDGAAAAAGPAPVRIDVRTPAAGWEPIGPSRTERTSDPAPADAPKDVQLAPVEDSLRQISVSKGFKSKSGKLSKDKSFELADKVGVTGAFTKESGHERISVDRSGRVTVGKGLKPGDYPVKVSFESRNDNGAARHKGTVVVMVKVK